MLKIKTSCSFKLYQFCNDSSYDHLSKLSLTGTDWGLTMDRNLSTRRNHHLSNLMTTTHLMHKCSGSNLGGMEVRLLTTEQPRQLPTGKIPLQLVHTLLNLHTDIVRFKFGPVHWQFQGYQDET